jgi:hypothetical protein
MDVMRADQSKVGDHKAFLREQKIMALLATRLGLLTIQHFIYLLKSILRQNAGIIGK